MFLRNKKVNGHVYLQIVENRWEKGRSRQRVLSTLGRLDRLREEDGEIGSLLESGSRCPEELFVLLAHRRGEMQSLGTRSVGAPLIFERLWREMGCAEVIGSLLSGRKFEFPVERAIFQEVFYRLVSSGAEPSGSCPPVDYRIEGIDDLGLHHVHRAVTWLGEPLEQETVARARALQHTKDQIEEELFARGRDRESSLKLIFFDAASIRPESETGFWRCDQHQGDPVPRRQRVICMLLDQEGRPVYGDACPGRMVEVRNLLPFVERLRNRFGVRQVYIVGRRNMFQSETLKALKEGGWPYVVGARACNPEVPPREGGRKDCWDGRWTLQTTRDFGAADAALAYKQLRMTENAFHSMKPIRKTHRACDRAEAAARGHVFCSLLALHIRAELQARLAGRGESSEWACILKDLESVEEIEVQREEGARYVLRTAARGIAGKVFQAVGVALPPVIRRVDENLGSAVCDRSGAKPSETFKKRCDLSALRPRGVEHQKFD
jgi:hypothetical protein